MKTKLKFIVIFLLIPISLLMTNSCGIYSLSGASLSPEIKTVTIKAFTNQANQVVPSFAEKLTEQLKDKFLNEMNLSIVDYNGDISFKGIITDYKIGPASISGDQKATTTRLTISVKVEYKNSVQPEFNYDATFSNYMDFESSENFASIKDDLHEELLEMLVQDIFSKAVNNW